MRQKVALYIDDRMVDLDDQSFILFNYTQEDLSNPTIVKNSFSKQITLKGTANNNAIFGDIFRMDRVTQYEGTYTGINFDPMRKTPFTLYNAANEIIEEGYLKLDEVTRGKGGVEYKITLYGGLGSFFYGLMYDSDGEKKSLASMRYLDLAGYHTYMAGYYGHIGGYNAVKACWSYLQSPEQYVGEAMNGVADIAWCNIINFAPCYNGIPQGFSADKAVISNGRYTNVPVTNMMTGTQSGLMVFSNPHTEWEMKDLRWYLQRPIFSIKALFQAICDPENNGGYEVILSDTFFAEDNDLYSNGWMTLPMIPMENREDAECIIKLLQSAKSPAEYIISFAKMFGLVFVMKGQKQILIMPRAEFYGENTDLIDLTDRINADSIKITPVLASSKFYQLGNEVIGEWAKSYKADFGRPYGIQRINTGMQFNDDTTILTDGIAFKDAVEVQERSLLFISGRFGRVGTTTREAFTLPKYEGVKLQEWKAGTDEQVMEEKDILYPYVSDGYAFNPDYPLSDFLPKVQLHDADNKSIDGSDVLLVFDGIKETPVWTSSARLEYRFTDDTSDMMTLNEGVPCWNFTNENSSVLTFLPSFRRCKTYMEDADSIISHSFEWGEPMARGVNGLYDLGLANLYDRWWRDYLEDRYDDDTFRMSCKVDLRGLRVEQNLLRRFFFYQNAVFVLNEIRNHSVTTDDDTECEFIKVQNLENYTSYIWQRRM